MANVPVLDSTFWSLLYICFVFFFIESC